jgi:hypothetical protein
MVELSDKADSESLNVFKSVVDVVAYSDVVPLLRWNWRAAKCLAESVQEKLPPPPP